MRITPVLGLLVLAVTAAALTGCGSGGEEPSGPAATPMGHTYISTEVIGGAIPGGGPMTLTFAEGRVSANSGCNTASGAVDLSEQVLHPTAPLAATMMACPGERGDADAWQIGFLESDPRWRLDGDRLILTGETVTVHLTDKKVLTPDKPLLGTTWVVTTLISQEAQVRSTTLDEVGPHLTIGEGGTVTGMAGCNQLSGTAGIGPGDAVNFAVATTKMMCAPEVMEVENDVLRALDGTTTATVDADQLTLRNENGYGLILHARQ
ncbi:META domain-containing protein [Nocardia rhizosphaerae]|uniref:META domain-containing protein n=1 Tax=Nocardia rhizosphaerae TaxID=1691571 RepID=A0ABV8L804_9NOCA